MKIVGEAFAGQFRAKRVPGEFGMEVETETLIPQNYPVEFLILDGAEKGLNTYKTPAMNLWKAIDDHSLRNYGIEFIFKKPYNYATAIKAIDQFGEATSGVKFVKDAPGTSVHVHTNMYNETFLTMANFATEYILFENTLQEFAGPTRRSNLFALPTRCSEDVAWNLIKMFEAIQENKLNYCQIDEEYGKYGALNLACFHKLGSFEIRSMRGTTDPKLLKQWLTIINSMLVFARQDGVTPRMLINQYKNRDIELFSDVFGDNAKVIENAMESDLQESIDKNLYYAGSIASCVKDWTTFGDNIQPFDKTTKTIAAKKKIPGDWIEQAGVQNVVEQFLAQGDAGQVPDPFPNPFNPLDAQPVPEPQAAEEEWNWHPNEPEEEINW